MTIRMLSCGASIIVGGFLCVAYSVCSQASCVIDECNMVVVWRAPNNDWVKEYEISSALNLRSTSPSSAPVMEATQFTTRSRLRGVCYADQCPGTIALTKCTAAGGTTGAWGPLVTRYNCVPLI